MENNKCAVLVTSCDAYSDAWYPFFELFKIMWKDCKFPIYLNTETQDYSHYGLDIKCLHPSTLKDKKGKDISWSRRLREALQQIDSEYIIFLLEDFFLMSEVREDIVYKSIEIMDNNENVSVIDFYSEPHESETVFDEFSYTDRNYDYCINAMAALWRRSFLLDVLRDDENPWKFEFNGTYRWRKTDKVILTHREEFSPVFDYLIKPKYGYGIYQGKWLWKNAELFEKHGIKADFSKRDTLRYEDLPDLEGREREENWLQNDFKKAFKDPKLFIHYAECLKNVTKDKLIRFYAAYIKR